jgi:nucleotide-binding universal stress UspA family protein
MSHHKKILVSTDYSERSRGAIRMALSLAHEGATVLIVHVVEEVHVISEGYREALEERLREHDPVPPGISVEYYLREGEPAEEIVKLANETGCDLIVVGSHGRSGVERLLVGSVAEKVLRAAHRPVLIVRA